MIYLDTDLWTILFVLILEKFLFIKIKYKDGLARIWTRTHVFIFAMLLTTWTQLHLLCTGKEISFWNLILTSALGTALQET